jgi:heme/copper-type cytochrome/quinol oxidase subunit 3
MPTDAIARPRMRREIVPSSVLGMLLFVTAELMFFLGFISAFTISRAAANGADWNLVGDVLPATATGFNTALLFTSGVLTFVAQRQLSRRSPAAERTLLAAWIFGAAFVALQGREWVHLLAQGTTLFSSRLGSFFYVIVGAHALHAVGALVALGMAWWSLRRGTLSREFFLGAQTFWYFVVGVWPIIYLRVYF